MKKYLNEDLIKILISIILLISSFFIQNESIKLIVLIISYIVISINMYIKLIKNIKNYRYFLGKIKYFML